MSVVIDAHQHFWHPERGTYPWLQEPALAPIRRPFGPEDLRPLLRANGVDYTVLVQTQSALQETWDFLEFAGSTDFVAGVVGWVDLTDPQLGAVLEQLTASPHGRYWVGIRHQVHDENDPNWLLRPDVQRGLAAVQEAGLVYDFLTRPRELPAALATVRRLPGLRCVIDHLSKPPIASGAMAQWRDLLQAFGEHPQVYCKLSGIVTEADWRRWQHPMGK